MTKNISDTRKTLVLDTSVLVYDPNAIHSFKGNDIVLPIAVLTELDKLKKEANEVGKNARVFTRYLDEVSNSGDIVAGVPINGDMTLRIDPVDHEIIGDDKSYGDNQILGCLSFLKKSSVNICLVSRDINLRIRARALGVESQDFSDKKRDAHDLYSGHRVVKNMEAGQALNERTEIDCFEHSLDDIMTNEFVLFTDDEGRGISTGRRYGKIIKKVEDLNPWGLELRNKEQLYLTNLLLDPKISLVSAIGPAGTGKSLICVAAALELVLNARKYEQLIIYRPIQPMGNDIGFLPGSQEEKLEPWFVAIDDSLAFLLGGASKGRDGWKEKLHQYIEKGVIKKEALTYIRGRSIPNSLIIIDEFQNLTPEDAKTILTRAGTGSKIILTGDIEQIDNHRLDAISNGLTYVIERFKGSRIAGHVTLTKGERSELATMASELL